jgi:hypothetical protein
MGSRVGAAGRGTRRRAGLDRALGSARAHSGIRSARCRVRAARLRARRACAGSARSDGPPPVATGTARLELLQIAPTSVRLTLHGATGLVLLRELPLVALCDTLAGHVLLCGSSRCGYPRWYRVARARCVRDGGDHPMGATRSGGFCSCAVPDRRGVVIWGDACLGDRVRDEDPLVCVVDVQRSGLAVERVVGGGAHRGSCAWAWLCGPSLVGSLDGGGHCRLGQGRRSSSGARSFAIRSSPPYSCSPWESLRWLS